MEFNLFRSVNKRNLLRADKEVISEEALNELNEQIWFLEEKCGIAPQGKTIPENNL